MTAAPDTAPPSLTCPRCATLLNYRHTVYGGVRPVERWDYFRCRACGEFLYRHRTRRLSSVITP